jgi:hypothetical protein
MTAIPKDEKVLETAIARLARVAQANASMPSDDSVWDGQASHMLQRRASEPPSVGQRNETDRIHRLRQGIVTSRSIWICIMMDIRAHRMGAV